MPLAPGQSSGASFRRQGISAFHALPLLFYLFSDGLYIQAAAPDRRDLVGAKVVRIGTKTVEAALEALRPFIHYDSEMWFKLADCQDRDPATSEIFIGEGYLGGGALVRPRDLLKVGQLYLNGGVWNGRRIVSRDWVRLSTAALQPIDERPLALRLRLSPVSICAAPTATPGTGMACASATAPSRNMKPAEKLSLPSVISSLARGGRTRRSPDP
jgi:hypothetical protein